MEDDSPVEDSDSPRPGGVLLSSQLPRDRDDQQDKDKRQQRTSFVLRTVWTMYPGRTSADERRWIAEVIKLTNEKYSVFDQRKIIPFIAYLVDKVLILTYLIYIITCILG